MKINIIVAFSKNMGIGLNNTLPWYIPSDLKKFRQLTIGKGNNAVIMGKNTWASLPCKYLKNRDNLILSKSLAIDYKHEDNKNKDQDKKIYYNKSFQNINQLIDYYNNKNYDIIWIIGGSQIYDEFINSKLIDIDKIYVTYIDNEFECDTFFPNINININNNGYSLIEQNNHLVDELYNFKIYDRIYNRIYNKI